jgi:hypothetical protein
VATSEALGASLANQNSSKEIEVAILVSRAIAYAGGCAFDPLDDIAQGDVAQSRG